MNSAPNALRKAIDAKTVRSEQPRRADVDRDAIIRESKAQYRGFVDAINRASDQDIEAALKRC